MAKPEVRARSIPAWLFGVLVLGIATANLLLVHPVPALAYAVVSLVYLPPVGAFVRRRFRVSIPAWLQVGLGIALVMFTLGVSDLGDMVD